MKWTMQRKKLGKGEKHSCNIIIFFSRLVLQLRKWSYMLFQALELSLNSSHVADGSEVTYFAL